MRLKRARSLMTRRKGKLSLMQLFGSHKTSILINDGPSLLLLHIRFAHLGSDTKVFFCVVYDYVEKADLSEGYQNPPKNGGNHAFFRDN